MVYYGKKIPTCLNVTKHSIILGMCSDYILPALNLKFPIYKYPHQTLLLDIII